MTISAVHHNIAWQLSHRSAGHVILSRDEAQELLQVLTSNEVLKGYQNGASVVFGGDHPDSGNGGAVMGPTKTEG